MGEVTQQARHTEFTGQYYRRGAKARETLLSAYGDAAHMCDAIAADLEREHTTRGRVTKRGQALAAAVRRAGDAIWGLRDAVRPIAAAAPGVDRRG